MIRQGDVYWVDLGRPSGSGPGFLHPHMVIQNDVFNQSQLETVVICGITSRVKWGNALGNVLLEPGEANLPKQSVVNVTQLYTVDREDLIEKIGTLSPDRVQQILDGLYLLLEPRELPESTE